LGSVRGEAVADTVPGEGLWMRSAGLSRKRGDFDRKKIAFVFEGRRACGPARSGGRLQFHKRVSYKGRRFCGISERGSLGELVRQRNVGKHIMKNPSEGCYYREG